MHDAICIDADLFLAAHMVNHSNLQEGFTRWAENNALEIFGACLCPLSSNGSYSNGL